MKSKQLIVVLLMMSICIKSYGQQNIRFIHRGEELKPVGTLSISTEKVIAPNDRVLDNIYGKAVKTDVNSFNVVADFVMKSKLLTNKPQKLPDNKEFYEIIIVYSKVTQKLYLGEKNTTRFFTALRDVLVKNKADIHLLDTLNY